MADQEIQASVERLSETLVMLEPGDLPGLAGVHSIFEEVAAWAQENGQAEAAAAAVRCAALVESIILQEADDPAATLELIAKAGESFQQVVAHGRDASEAPFPPELLGQSAGSPGAEASEEHVPLKPLVERAETAVKAWAGAPSEATASAAATALGGLQQEAAGRGLPDIERATRALTDAVNEGVDAGPGVLNVTDWIRRAARAHEGQGAPPGPPDEVIAALSGAPAAAEGPTEIALEADPGLLGDFVVESREHLEAADLHLLTLETTPEDEEAVNAVFRAFHTIKGVAGFLSLEAVQHLAHEAETLLDKARKGELRLEGSAVDITFEAIDALKQLVDSVSEALASGGPMAVQEGTDTLIERIQAVVEGRELSGRPTPTLSEDDERLGEALIETGAADEEGVGRALEAQETGSRPKIGEVLVENVSTNSLRVEDALEIQRQMPDAGKLGEVLVEMGATTPDQVEGAVRKQQSGERAKLGEVLVKQHGAKAQDVALALRAQKQQRSAQTSAPVREAVKVDADRLDHLVDLIGELVISESMVANSPELLSQMSPQLARHIGQLNKNTRELQEIGTSLRMVPVRATFQKMARLVRDLAKKAGKKVQFTAAGEETELDKTVVDKIGDPLVHMVRNSVDHGIEASEEERVAAGKPPEGRVELRAFHKGGNIYIEIEDDGRGLDRDAILAKATERGLVREGEPLSDRDVFGLIFQPGFSTAKQITDVSGRGVGMDVVKRNIEALRGQIEVSSEQGRGTTISVRLPLTLAIIDGMVVRVGGERYIIPTLSIVRTVRPEPGDLITVANRGEMLSLQGQLIPLFRLDRLFETPGAEDDPCNALVIVVEDDGKQAGLLTDELLGQQQTVIKSLGASMKGLAGISGGAIMSDGNVGLILDVGGIVKLANQIPAGRVASPVQ